MPRELVEPYTRHVVEAFREFHPLWVASGDTNFGPEQITDYYTAVLRAIRESDPGSPTAMHMAGNMPDLPPEFPDSGLVDLYMYQSGHGPTDQGNAREYALNLLHKPVRRPIVNSEPCYEGIPYSVNGRWTGRYTREDVRRALWRSLLSGSCGFGYGGHGLWMWQGDDSEYTNAFWSGRPFHWRTALGFEGARDPAHAKDLVERYGLSGLHPMPDGSATGMMDGVLAASTPGGKRMVVYTPSACDVSLKCNTERFNTGGLDWVRIDLDDRKTVPAVIESMDGATILRMPESNGDCLWIGTNESEVYPK